MGSGQRWGPGGQWRRRGEEQEEAVLEESLWRTGRPELLPSLRYLHAHQHLLRGEAELHRPALPRYVPCSEGGEEKWPVWQRRLGLGKGQLCPSAHHCPLQCLAAGAHGQSGQHAPSPAGAR